MDGLGPFDGEERRLKCDEDLDAREWLPPKLAAMAISIQAHFHDVRRETGNATLAYREACRLDPENPDYPADVERYEQWFRQIAAEQERKLATLGVIVPKASPQPQPSQPPPSRLLALPLSPSPSAALSWQHEQRGLNAERKRKWAKAQAEFARGTTWAAPDEPQCRLYLHRAVRNEILAGSAPVPFAKQADKEDARLRLPRELQAALWAERGLILEAMGRLDEAELAICQAGLLAPTDPRYPLFGHRIATRKRADELAAERAAEAARPPATETIWGIPPLANWTLNAESH